MSSVKTGHLSLIMNIIPKPDITDEEILKELKNMTLDEILSIPLSGQFTGLFKTFTEMGRIVQTVGLGKVNYGSFSEEK